MRQGNFRKCSRCYRFSKIFQCVINREEHKLSYFWSKAIFKTVLRMENIGQIYHKHAIREILNCDMTKALEQDFWEKTLPKLV